MRFITKGTLKFKEQQNILTAILPIHDQECSISFPSGSRQGSEAAIRSL